MTKILGIDQATTTGWAILENGDLIKYGKFTVNGDWVKKVSQIKKNVERLINDNKPDIVAIEDVQQQANPQVFKKLAELKGVLENMLYERYDVDYKIISSNSWKSTCGIKKKGRTKEKKASQQHVKTVFSVNVTQDEADAINISYHIYVDNKK